MGKMFIRSCIWRRMWKTFVPIVLVSGFALNGYGAPRETPEQVLAAARQADQSLENKKALRHYKKALSYSTTRVDALIGLSHLYMKMGELDEPLEAITEYLRDEDPFNPALRALMAELQHKKGLSAQALATVQSSIWLNPSDTQAKLVQAQILFDLKKYDLAQKAATEFLQKNSEGPGAFDARFIRGRSRFYQEQYPLALDDLKFLAEGNPVHLGVHDYLGKTHLKSNNLADADRAFIYLLKLNPKSSTVLEQLGEVALAQKRVPEAILYFEKSIAIDPSRFSAGNQLALAYKATGQLDRAIGEYSRQLELDPTQPNSIQGMYHLLAEAKRFDKLGPFLKRAFEYPANFAYVGVRYGNLLSTLGEYRRAEEVLSRTIAESGETREALLQFANTKFAQGEYKAALSYLEAAGKKFPEDPLIQFNQALVQEKMGAFGEALVLYKTIGDTFPNSHKARINAAILLEKEKKFEDALEMLKSIRDPSDQRETVFAKIAEWERTRKP